MTPTEKETICEAVLKAANKARKSILDGFKREARTIPQVKDKRALYRRNYKDDIEFYNYIQNCISAYSINITMKAHENKNHEEVP